MSPFERPSGPQPKIPLTILTGFLGAGKTTLLNRLLKTPALDGTVVIVNEFGSVGLDHLLIEAADEDMVLLSAGCLCCTIKGDLIATLEGLLRKRDNGRIAPFRRVVIETTGLADPAPILHTVMAHPYLSIRYRLEGVVTVVDAVNGANTLDAHVEAVKQVAVADRLVVSKAELCVDGAERGGLDALRSRLRRLNPAVPIVETGSSADVETIIDCGLFDVTGKIADVGRWLNDEALLGFGGHRHDHHGHDHGDAEHGGHPHGSSAPDGGDGSQGRRDQDPHDPNRHDASIRAFAFRCSDAIPSGALSLFQDLLRSAHGPRLLRVKGIVKTVEDPERPVVLHGVQHVFHPPEYLDAWPNADRDTRLVFITRDLDAAFVERLWTAFVGPRPTA